jgi:16S rRNA (guanine527-N7)-methyltransferase
VPLLVAEGSSSRRRTPPGGATTRGGAGLRILDLGSGGGFPGLPLAAALADAQVTLADSVAKKAAFLQVVVAATALADRVTARATRAEALAAAPARWDVVTARAVGSLPDLVELALPLLEVGGRLIAWKRGAIEDELLGGQRAAEALGGGSPELRPIDAIPALAGHVLVTVRKHRPTPAGYPRDPARRSRQPW